MAINTRSVVAGAALGACAGAIVAWAVERQGTKGEDLPAVSELSRGQILSVLWAVIGVIRLVLELDNEG